MGCGTSGIPSQNTYRQERSSIETIRKRGWSWLPFQQLTESEYDAFGVGHSSTSISAILGMAIAAKDSDPDKKHVAVIGDGAITAGMAFEALSHSGHLKPNMLIILNDNDMSISENIGGLVKLLFENLGLKDIQRHQNKWRQVS